MKATQDEPVTPTKFGSLTLYSPRNALFKFNDWYEYDRLVAKSEGGRSRPWRYIVCADEIHLRPNGNMIVKSGNAGIFTSMKITTNAFYQMLQLMKIPLEFAKRMPSDILVALVNRYFETNYAKNIVLRLTPDKDIIVGVSGYSKKMQETFNEDNTLATAWGFLKGIAAQYGGGQYPSTIVCDQDVTQAIFHVPNRILNEHGINRKNRFFKPVIEIIFSESHSFLPHACLGQEFNYDVDGHTGRVMALFSPSKKIDDNHPDTATKLMTSLTRNIDKLPNEYNEKATVPVSRINEILKKLNKKHSTCSMRQSSGNTHPFSIVPALNADWIATDVLTQRKVSFAIGEILRLCQ